MPAQTVVFWGPLEISRGFDLTFEPGIAPSICQIYTVPHVDGLPNVADLTFYQIDENGDPLYEFTLTECLLEAPRLVVSPDGNYWTIPVQDRRWKWQFAAIYGAYNIPNPDGLTYRNEKTPQELASLLLDAMGESGYDVSQLPNDSLARPYVEWSGSGAAAELDSLCQQFDCLIVLNALTDNVELWPEGTGRDNPPLPSDIQYSGLGDAPVYRATPQRIRVEGAETLFQATFATFAVAKETDGNWVGLEDAGYAQSDPGVHDGDWSGTWPSAGFSGLITSTYEDPLEAGITLQAVSLADQTAFKSFKLLGLAVASWGWSPPLLAGTDLEPQKLQDDLKLFDSLAEEIVSEPDDQIIPLAARIYCQHEPELPNEIIRPPTPIVLYPHGFSLDTVHGIINTPTPVFFIIEEDDPADKYPSWEGGIRPANVVAEMSFYAGRNGVYHREGIEADTGSDVDTPMLVIQRPEIRRRVIYKTSDNDFDSSGDTPVSDNVDDCQERLQYWLNAELAKYTLQQGGTATYESLVPLAPDGLIEQIHWHGGLDGPRTTASAAQRHNRYVPKLTDQRWDTQLKRMDDALDLFAKATNAQVEGNHA